MVYLHLAHILLHFGSVVPAVALGVHLRLNAGDVEAIRWLAPETAGRVLDRVGVDVKVESAVSGCVVAGDVEGDLGVDLEGYVSKQEGDSTMLWK